MAIGEPIYIVTPQNSGSYEPNDLTGKDEVPHEKNIGSLKNWLGTAQGVAYLRWAKSVPKWDVYDMVNESVYTQGTGSSLVYWVPAANNGQKGSFGRYYWIPVRITRDAVAEAQRDAVEIQAQREAAAAIAAAQGTPVSPSGALSPVATLPPGPTATGMPSSLSSGGLIEFSLNEGGDGWWTARSPQASAAGQPGNPHRGVSIINPGTWEQIAGTGVMPRDVLGLDTYKEEGWTGLDQRFLEWDTDGTVKVAGEILATTMDAAVDGDLGAEEALNSVGVRRPKRPVMDFFDGFF